MERLDCLGVGDARERLLHLAQQGQVALEDAGEVLLVLLEDPADDGDEEVLGEVHVSFEVEVGHLGFDHPELGQVPPRLALLRAEGGTEHVRLADRHRRRLAVELAALGEERLAQIEVGNLEQRRGALASRGREDGRVDQRESAFVVVVADGLDERVPHREDGALPRAAQPQVSLLLQEPDPVLLRLDGIARLALQDAQILDVHLEADRAARILRHRPAHFQRGLLWSVLGGEEGGLGNVLLGDDALDDAGAVPQLDEVELAARSLAVEPPAKERFLPFVGGDVADVDVRFHR